MPRGFLVKRLPSSKYWAPASYRVRRYSDEDRSDSSSDHDGPPPNAHHHHQPQTQPHASPDSGFGSPTLLLAYRAPRLDLDDKSAENINRNGDDGHFYNRITTGRDDKTDKDNVAAPLALTTRPQTQIPASNYLSNFDQFMLSLCSTPPHKNPTANSPTFPPPSPHKKRVNEVNGSSKGLKPKKSKAVRRLTFDEDKTSPVSGTIIRDFDDDDDDPSSTTPQSVLVVRKGDIDPSFNVVEATDEAKAEIAKIENRIGDYICQLCKKCYEDAFGLAQHRCSRIIHVEYRCPECDKVFNCPANLASHRRWHKPRPTTIPPTTTTTTTTTSTANSTKTLLPPPPRLLPAEPPQTPILSDSEASNGSLSRPCSPGDASSAPNADELLPFECDFCNKKFRRQAYLRKHLASHSRTLASSTGELDVRSAGSSGDSTNDVGGPYACKYCVHAFATSPGLTRHINKFHPSETRQVILLQLPQH